MYEEGYAPEEIARLVIASEGEPVSLERIFDRVQAGKNAVSTSLNFQKSFQVPWGSTHDAFNREQFEEYLEKRKQEGVEGLREVRDGGYWFKFKEWDRRRRKEIWSRVDKADYVSTSEIMEDYSIGSRSREVQISKRRREPIPNKVKRYVWQRDGGRCVECGSKERLEYDHIIPLSKGGSNTERNIQLLCEHHNRSKGSSIS
jgi:5-methylcytosine-specific restriction endonuclease McrA